MEALFIHLIYQPFLNILVFFYWMLGQIPGVNPDMGVAVILLTIVIRLLLLPLTIASDRSETEREEISKEANRIQNEFRSDPVRLRGELKKIMRSNPRILLSEFTELAINVVITIMLIRIFASGLEGEDLSLLYSWAPHPQTPYNLVFWGIFDLSKPNFFLNLIQSFVILIVEIVAEFTSPFRNIMAGQRPTQEYNAITNAKNSYAFETRSRIRSLQFFLPIVSFLVFMFLPAGKKLFIITTLLFSILFMLLKAVRRKFIQINLASQVVKVEVASEEIHAPSKQ